jgi:hypothetical protein
MSRSVPGPVPRIYRDGAAYNPLTRTWRKLPPMPAGRYGGIALWDGTEVLFLGGYPGGCPDILEARHKHMPVSLLWVDWMWR